MPNTRDRVYEAAENIKPYVDRAMSDEQLRGDVLRAFQTARELYSELSGKDRRAVTLATRVATDDDIREKLRDALEDLRSASNRLQGKRDRRMGRNTTLLIAAVALAILYNPVTGRETRQFIKDMVTGGSSDRQEDFSVGNGSPAVGS